MWPWIETNKGTLIKITEIEAISVTKDVDVKKYRVLIRTRGGGKYTYALFDLKEEAQKELLRLAETIARIEEQTLERA
ncbi:hypothetical protein SAMN06269117_11435 [Balnearium lithotrophicum]|uniref:Uncharacterized protein n=1 Tax=Balnearium lithotrophicum TaxID=223788 RepID=A0A521CP31_9BACT|nr:hypothetical protein [Balnearium lithotrophicum]SMO61214.1 hypothetical protein SAMN06269117_11435 [Balnearium lithotrophicum]